MNKWNSGNILSNHSNPWKNIPKKLKIKKIVVPILRFKIGEKVLIRPYNYFKRVYEIDKELMFYNRCYTISKIDSSHVEFKENDFACGIRDIIKILKIGDKVMIRKYLEKGHTDGGLYIADAMTEYSSRIAYIKVTGTVKVSRYSLDIDDGDFWWSDECFEWRY